MRSWIILCLLSLWIVEGHGALPVRIYPTVIGQERENGCPSQEAINDQLNVTKKEIKQRINDTVISCGGIGWTRVAYLDVRDPGSVCPTSWTLRTSPVRGCSRSITTSTFSCASAKFSARGQRYSRVCGRILGYQKGTTEAFYNSVSASYTSIESAYVDGVSVTHGPIGSRQHIWTFTTALYKDDPSYNPLWNCPCTNTRRSWPYQLPSFIQNNYFCDTGNPGPGYDGNLYYSSDPLWDGAGCGAHSTCCEFNNPPWFYSTLPRATTDDVEVRLCHGERLADEDTIVYLIEINVQLQQQNNRL